MTEEIELAGSSAIVPLTPNSMQELMRIAVEKGSEGVEILERLVALDERVSARRAAMAFAAAMARFKATCPPVPRRTPNAQFSVSRNGVMSPRLYASLQDIEATIRAPTGECGLYHRWTDASVSAGMLTMACVVSHVGGHSISSPIAMPLESKAGCSEQQKFGITYAYSQRYSLINAYGLTSCEEDTDGATEPVPCITPDQVVELVALIDRCPPATHDRLMAFAGVKTLDDIPASRFASVRAKLETKVVK